VTQYILRRIMLMFPMLLGISIISYLIIRLAPGDPTRILADPEMLTIEQMEGLRRQLGLDQPIHVQYFKTMQALLSGDLLSYKTRQPVVEMIVERLPTTLTLATLVIITGFTFGIVIGVIQALKRNTFIDDVLTFLSLFGFAVPAFWLALMLMLIFAVRLDWLPASGIRPSNASGGIPGRRSLLRVADGGAGDQPGRHRGEIRAVVDAGRDQPGLHANRAGEGAKGDDGHGSPRATELAAARDYPAGRADSLSPRGDRRSGDDLALPGVGRLALDSVVARDYPVILTVNLSCGPGVIGDLVSDIAYGIADPRVRVSE
jgi:ABC-type dipeptide/oligopeptide/nickel transport system permease component